MATITLEQTRTNEPGGTYKVVNLLKNAVGIPNELFALKSTSAEFSHVVNVGEIELLPLLDTPPAEFYRVDTVTKEYPNIASAISFAEGLKRRVDILIEEYTAEAAAFPGGEDTDFPLP